MAGATTDRTDRMVTRLAWGGFWLGFALGGFFDGILLHQILQWHHLLSGVASSGTVPDLRLQVIADGVFHLSHYVFAVLGLWLLWSGRAAFAATRADRRVIGWALIGFGTWHIIDAVLVHWILQLHRIRMDVENPLIWDLLWVMPFGIGVVALGAWLLRRRPDEDGDASGGRGAAAALGIAALAGGMLAALPPADLPDDDLALVVFRAGQSCADTVAAVDAVDGKLVWTDENAGVWLIAVGQGATAASLYRHGAILVSTGPVAVGCLSWTEIRT